MSAAASTGFNPFNVCAKAREISRLLDVSAVAFAAWESEQTAESWQRWIESRRAIDSVQRGSR